MIQSVSQVKLQTSVSFRALQKLLITLQLQVALITTTPTAPTLMNWIKKIGYYELTKEKEKSDDWIILLDHSIQLGREKVFVVLGIQADKIEYGRALNYADLEPMLLVIKEKWDGQAICNYLTTLQERIGNIIYAIGDYGSDIKKGLELAGVPHVRDLTHELASIIEKLYKKDPDYVSLTKKMGEIRMKLGQTESAYAMPPNQRQKSRFLNIGPISTWARDILNAVETGKIQTLGKRMREQVEWIESKKAFIEELSVINTVKSKIEKLLKTQGLNEKTIENCIQFSSGLIGEKGKIFAGEISKYLKSTFSLSKKERMICSSDILESAFGKYKNYLSKNPMACVTDLVLCIPAFTCKLTEENIKEALETVKIKQLQKWKQDNICKTLLSKRKELFKKVA